MAWAKVQGQATASFGSGTTITMAYGSNNAVGNLLVCAFCWDANVAPTSVADTRGNTWVLADTRFDSNNSASLSVYYCASAIAGANTVTATWAATHGFTGAVWAEFSGVAASSVADGAIGQAVAGSTATDGDTSTAITTTTAGDLIFGAFHASGGGNYTAVGTGFTIVANMSTDLAAEYLVQGAAGSVAAPWTSSSTARYVAIVAAFKAAVAATGLPELVMASPR